ncbi:PD-(D/E)XK motif protein [Kribbella sp. NBC_00709]|uniref:PD-(D/E)XK motif protein n=1 Tax=Kribbella sp. NBC_00709 TaxID=2975972 RepID=UPI002E2C2E82|nr:PD-(D/E)XK motif protein [Kribbella sp. NBC_00709]
MNGNSTDRHRSIDTLERYLSSSTPIALAVQGTPEIQLFIEPTAPELGLRVEVSEDTEAPTLKLRHVVCRLANRDNRRFLEVAIVTPGLFRDAYPMLCTLADRIQLDHLAPSSALQATLDSLAALLSGPDVISREREIGLVGELLTVTGLVDVLGPQAAVEAWRGVLGEEHDFGLADFDLEVKTTTGERRVHWIESLTQLVPTQTRPLWLLSHQLTVAGTRHGWTLPELVDRLTAKAQTSAVATDFANALSAAGWRPEQRPRITTRWARRVASAAYEIVDGFPRLTPALLETAGVELQRIPSVRYRVDLEGLEDLSSIPQLLTDLRDYEGLI